MSVITVKINCRNLKGELNDYAGRLLSDSTCTK
jgi:hypothetical protein